MTEYVRAHVTRDGAADYATTTSAIHAASEGWKVLDEPTHDRAGAVIPDARIDGRPEKPKTSVAQAAAEKKAETSANSTDIPTSKES